MTPGQGRGTEGRAGESQPNAQQEQGAGQPAEQRPGGKMQANPAGGKQRNEGAAGQQQESGQPQNQRRDAGGEGKQPGGQGARAAGHGGHPPHLSGEQRGKFRGAILGLHVAEVAAAGVAFAVGATIPRTIELHELPPVIVEEYPDYDGYEFFLSHGDIVVVDPDTLAIVDVFPA